MIKFRGWIIPPSFFVAGGAYFGNRKIDSEFFEKIGEVEPQ